MPDTPITHLLYLHGFRSSPQSAKARQMAALMVERFAQVTWWCPQLPPSPREAAALIAHGTREWPTERMAVIGSSLGGFYATWLASRRHCRAVLINPAVFPARDLARYIGEQTTWQAPEEHFYFAPAFVDELQTLQDEAQDASSEETLAFIAKGDEVLDWREMAARYPQARQVVLEGGDHALSDFDIHIPAILQFLGLT